MRKALVVVGVAMLLAGLFVLVLPWEGRPLGFYALVFAAVPFGIAYGRQERQYYL